MPGDHAPHLHVVPPDLDQGRELLRTGVIVAARRLAAAMLREQRELLRAADGPGYAIAAFNVSDALEELRAALWQERISRGAR